MVGTFLRNLGESKFAKFLGVLSLFGFYFANDMSFTWNLKSNAELVTYLKKQSVIKSKEVEEVMKKVDRGKYVRVAPYADSPQYIGYGVTISAPHMHALALEELKDVLTPGAKVLDVGSGSGYLTACMGTLVAPGGVAVGIDHIPELIDDSRNNIKSDSPALLTRGQVKLVVGDGRKGYSKDAPYDAIHVGASTPSVPQDLLDQLKPNGRLVIPIGSSIGEQHLERIDKDANGRITRRSLMGVRFVPLTDKDSQLKNS